MDNRPLSHHLPAFVEKMSCEGLQPIVIDTFCHYYRKVLSGETGLIRDADITSLRLDDLKQLDELDSFASAGRDAIPRAVRIILNGGLGTSMGLKGPKSLLPVRNDKSFLDILLRQAETTGIRVVLMNSFSTHQDTLAALKRIGPSRMPRCFIQHKFPKIMKKDLSPARWPDAPDLEWNPPGHGDIYTALVTSGTLDTLLAEGIEYAFISNSDNLGAIMEPSLLGYFAWQGFPFMMEVAQRTPADVKGGHLARHKDGYLLLRESAQCPKDELDAFRDIRRYRFFNTNNLWINLKHLKTLVNTGGAVRLPMILNPKTLDPRDAGSPEVFQIETAMGTAISLFEGATAVCVPRGRFFPVKKCEDLLAIRSDYYIFSDDYMLSLHPARRSDALTVRLDPAYYGKIDQFDERFSGGSPSLVGCESLTIRGDVWFEENIRVKGHTTITQTSDKPAVIAAGSVIEGDIIL